jgi:hypothetical protein
MVGFHGQIKLGNSDVSCLAMELSHGQPRSAHGVALCWHCAVVALCEMLQPKFGNDSSTPLCSVAFQFYRALTL